MTAELVVGAARHLEQRPAAVGGGELQRLGLARLDHLLERRVEGADREPLGLRLVHDAEARIDAGGGGVGGEQPAAEPVDRRDPGPVGRLERLAQGLQPVSLGFADPDGELIANPPSKLVRGALGEGEGENPLDPAVRVERGGAEAVDEHARLPGPGAGAEEDVAIAALDRRSLLAGALGAHSSSPSSDQGSSSGSPRSRRQIGWKEQ